MTGANGKELNPLWVAEFRGFFYADGYIGITTNGSSRNGKHKAFSACVQITLTRADEAVLLDAQEKLGGTIWYEGRGRVSFYRGVKINTKPYCAWRIRSRADIERVLTILEDGILPSKKKKEIPVLREFLSTVRNIGSKFSSAAEREKALADRKRLHKAIKAMHK